MSRCSAVVIFAAAQVLIASCVVEPKPFPVLYEEEQTDSVAVVSFRRGTYLEQFPECAAKDVICLDPPPFELRVEVVENVFGDALPRFITFASTSHYGIPDQKDWELRLVHLVTDGTSVLMPRYHSAAVGEDARGELVIPVAPEEIWWLPCGTNTLKRRVSFAYPEDGFAAERDLYDPEELLGNEEYYAIGERWVKPKFGIPVDSLKGYLEKLQPTAGEFACDGD